MDSKITLMSFLRRIFESIALIFSPFLMNLLNVFSKIAIYARYTLICHNITDIASVLSEMEKKVKSLTEG